MRVWSAMPTTQEQNEIRLKGALERIVHGQNHIHRMEKLISDALERGASTADMVKALQHLREVQVTSRRAGIA